MPSYPNSPDDTVLYDIENIYGTEPITVRMLNDTDLNIWGNFKVNGNVIDSSVVNVKAFGAKGDGVTNDHAALVVATTNPADIVVFPAGTYLDSTGQLLISNSISIQATPGAVFKKTHNGNAIQIIPTAVSGGTVNARVAGDTTVTVAGATWTTNEHVGKWAHLAATFPEARKVVSNTTDTLTLDYPLGNTVAAGVALNFYTPMEVNIDGLTIDGNNLSGAGLIIQYASRIRLKNVSINKTAGNGLSIYWSENVVVEDLNITGGFFGAFVYGCRNGKIVRPLVRNWTDEYGVQAKDCIGFDLIDADVDPLTAGGNYGLNIKASGLNPAIDCRIVNGLATNCGSFGYYMYSVANEGTYFGAENFEMVGGLSRKCISDWGVLVNEGGSIRNGKVTRMQGLDATSAGFLINGNDIEAKDIYTEGPGARSTILGLRNIYEGTIKNPCMNGTADCALRLDNADFTRVDIKVIHTIAGSAMNRAVREMNGCTNNDIRREIHDLGGTAMTGDVLLEASNNTQAWRNPNMDELNTSTPLFATLEVPYYGTAAPTTGRWLQGDIVYNRTAVASGFIGWVCTVAGTPGTWKTFGAISA